MKIKLLKNILILLLISINNNFGQTYNFVHYNTNNGLPDSYIYYTHQDQLGYLYIATLGGLSKFNGVEFINYNLIDGLAANEVTYINSDNNNLWVGTFKGLSLFDGRNFKNYKIGETESSNWINSILTDSKNNVWICTNGGLFVKREEKFELFSQDSIISKSRFYEALEDSSKNLWFASNKGVINISEGNIKRFSTENNLQNDTVYCLETDSKGNLYIGTRTGIDIYSNGKIRSLNKEIGIDNEVILDFEFQKDKTLWVALKKGLVKYKNGVTKKYTSKEGLDSDYINDIFIDSEENLWIGTERGLSNLSDENLMVYSKFHGYPTDVWQIYKDYNENILLGTDGEGVKVLSGSELKDLRLNGLKSKVIYAIQRDSNNDLWIGTIDEIAKFDGKTYRKIPSDYNVSMSNVSKILLDSKNNLWISSLDQGIYCITKNGLKTYNEKNGLTSDEVYVMYEGLKGEIWVGNGRSLNRIYNNEIKDYSHFDWLRRRSIMTIIQDADSNLWLGTYEKGLISFNPYKDETKPKIVSMENGLNDNAIMITEIDDSGFMWIGTNKGINKLNLNLFNETGEIFLIPYSKYHGLLGEECYQGSSLKDNEGNLWFGTKEGVLKYTNQGSNEIINPPKLYITNIELFFGQTDIKEFSEVDSNYILPKSLELPYNINHITFSYDAINFNDPTQIRFKYMLVGEDKEFSPITKDRSVTYTSLSPGDYEFIVEAANLSGIWSKEYVSYSFSISSPFWNTWSFYTVVILIISFSVYAGYRIRVKQIKDKNILLQQRIDDRIAYEKKLKQSEEDYKGLFENAHNPIIIFDSAKFDIIDANQSALHLSEYSIEEIKKLRILDLLIDPKKIIPAYKTILAGKNPKDLDIEFKSKGGKTINLSVKTTVVNYSNKKAILGICRDITEEKKIRANLLMAKKNAEKSNRLKSEFLAQMSHEIRTPVNTILNFMSLVKEDLKDHLTEDSKMSFELMEGGGIRLIKTIDQILNMSEAQAGTLKLNFEKVNVYEDILVLLFNEYKHIAKGKGLELRIKSNYNKRLISKIDRYSITQVFTNLLDNAIKYTEIGFVEIILNKEDENNLSVEIKDSGIGISNEFQKDIFNPFTQEEQGYTRRFEGNGLGLALVKNYCDLNKAGISVQSIKGEGSTFKVIFNAKR